MRGMYGLLRRLTPRNDFLDGFLDLFTPPTTRVNRYNYDTEIGLVDRSGIIEIIYMKVVLRNAGGAVNRSIV